MILVSIRPPTIPPLATRLLDKHRSARHGTARGGQPELDRLEDQLATRPTHGFKSLLRSPLRSQERHWILSLYHNVREESTTNSSSSSSAELVAFLKAAADNVDVLDEPGSSAYLAREVGRKTFSLMLKTEEDLNLSLTLHQIGLDSLMAIELRRWLKQAFGLDMSVLEIKAQGTLEAFGSVIAKALKERFRGA